MTLKVCMLFPVVWKSIVMVVVAVILWKVRKRLSVQPLMLT